MYWPKQIVSGDFYYLTKRKNKIIVAVADCTGHGVPGAFMSMLGIAHINEIVNTAEFDCADQILNELKERIMNSLHQRDEESKSKDGMDIALCIIDLENLEMQFSGAYNPVYIMTNNNLEVLRGDRMPIGFHYKEDCYFTCHHYSLKKGDTIYLFSDGYCDQFGGENHNKFMTKRFNHLLLDINQYPLPKQKEWLENTMREWMDDKDQVDDITVLGIKI
ncbi:MAG: SpoIIE family protein phosphatase [Bacteroidales bacterium]|nr:SpoIIE family protein phosphatase [Bacteroidales bacterium]